MADEPMERISIEVTANSEAAVKGLESLNRALSKLKKLSDAIGDLSGLKQIDSLASSIERLSNTGNGEGLKSAISNLRSLSKINLSNLSDMGSNIDTSGIERLNELTSSVGDFVRTATDASFNKALSNLRKLSKIDFSNFSGVKNTASAVHDLIDNASRAVVPVQGGSVSERPFIPVFPKLSDIDDEMSTFTSNSFQNAADDTAEAYKKIADAAKDAGEKAEEAGNRAKKAIEKATSSTSGLSKFFASLKRIAFYRIIRGIISGITKGIKEGLDNLYQYSKAFSGDFAKSMDSIATSSLYLKNSIATAISPLIEELAPVFEWLVNKIAEGIDKLNQFVAILRGQSSWTRAVRVQTEYAEAIEDTTAAAKELKNTVLGFDELNLLNDSTSSSSSKGKTVPDYSSMFEEVPIENASEGVKKWAERIQKVIDKVSETLKWIKQMYDEYIKPTLSKVGEQVRKFIDWLDLDLQDILRIVGLIAAAVLTVKFAQTFTDGLRLLKSFTDQHQVTIGLAIALTGLTIAGKAGYDWGKNGFNWQDLLKSAIGAGLAAVGGYIAFGAAGAIIGFTASILVSIIGYSMGRHERVWDSELGKQLLEMKEEIEKDYSLAIEVQAQINLHREEVRQKISDIETDFAALKLMLDEIFNLDAKDNKTAVELDTMKRLAQELNDYGIEIHIDEEGHVVETREQLEKLIEKTEEYYKLQAYQEGLIQAYKDQALAERGLQKAQDDLTGSSRVYKEQLDKVLEALPPYARDMAIAEGTFGDYAGLVTDFMTENPLLLFNGELWDELDLLREAEKNYNRNKDAVDILRESYDGATSDVGFYMDKITEANKQVLDVKTDNTKLLETLGFVGQYPGLIGTANQQKLITLTDNTQVNGTLNLVKDYPGLVGQANGVTLKTNVDDRELRDLEERIAALGNATVNVTQKYGGKGSSVSKYASGGFPDTGEMFIAREAGAELVGSIGRKTAVANNDQIVAGISDGVRDANEDVVTALYAVSQQIIQTVRDKDTSVTIDGKKLSREVTNAQNRSNRMYGATLQNV